MKPDQTADFWNAAAAFPPRTVNVRDLPGYEHPFKAPDPIGFIRDVGQPQGIRDRNIGSDLPPLLLVCEGRLPPAAWNEPARWSLITHQCDGFSCGQVEALVLELAWRDGMTPEALAPVLECQGYNGDDDASLLDATNRSIGQCPEMTARYQVHLARLGVTCEESENLTRSVYAWYRIDAHDKNLRALSAETRSINDLLGSAPQDLRAYLAIPTVNCD